jgi:serine/threonine-protein kinase
MNTTSPHVSPPEATEAHRPTPNNRPVAELVTGSAPLGENELVPLLRKRLRFLLVVFALYFLVILVLHFYFFLASFATRIDFWASGATFLACFGLALVLSSRPGMTLRQLRVVEFLLFAVFGLRMFLRGYVLLWGFDYINRILFWIASGDVENAQAMLTGIAYRLTAASAMFGVAYGVIIPNTWRRCAIVVAAFTALPIGIWLAACVNRGLPVEYWFPFQTVIAFMVVILTAVLAVYGAYRIESSRQEAVEARRLGQYVLREKIGGGGMGEVYLADHVLLRRPCALKLIRPERAGDPDMLQRFEREVRATASLTHPNAVQVFDYGHTPDGTFYYVMEYLPGPTLEELVKHDGPLLPERAIHFLRQLCGALAEAHAVGLIHRDIKPSNVLVCERGKVPDVAKLLDFGLVQSAVMSSDEKLTQVGSVLGTPAFLAPEQAAGESVDARTDIYSLGALAYFLLIGRPPFVRKGPVQLLAAHLHEIPEPPRHLRPDIPADLEAVVLRCLAKKPDDRFADVRSLDRALADCASSRSN